MTAANPRIQEARNRAASAKRALAFVSVAGFLAAFVLARAGHPGHSSAAQPATPSVTPVTGESSDDEGESLGFGSASIAPSQNVAPSVQTSTS
jgi:hypothetical protein